MPPAPPAPPPRTSAAPLADPDPDPSSQAWCGEEADYVLFDHERAGQGETDAESGDAEEQQPGDVDGGDPEEGDEPDGYEAGRYQDLDEAEDTDGIPELPHLDEAAMGEDDLLAELVDEVLLHDPSARAAQHQLVEHQERLHLQLPPEHWTEVLAMEEVANARWADASLVLVRWAWFEGRCAGREEG